MGIQDIKVGVVNDAKLIPVSFSELKTFRRCKMQHHYKYIKGLERKRKKEQLYLGSAVHSCLEGLYRTGEWKPAYKTFKRDFNKLFEEEREHYGDLPKKVFRLMRGYSNAWKNDLNWKVMGVEVPFKCRLPNSPVVLKGIMDLIVRDKSGIWVVEHKTHKSLPSNDFRMTEVQTALYYYVLSQYIKENVTGVVFNYIRTKAPTVPQLLKSGSLSKKKIDTDRATYLAEIKKHGLDRDDYEDILKRLSYKTFYKRSRIARPDVLINNLVREAIITGHTINLYRERRLHPDRTITIFCEKETDCDFYPLCYGELQGHDTSYVLNTLYQLREEEGDGKEEEQKEKE